MREETAKRTQLRKEKHLTREACSKVYKKCTHDFHGYTTEDIFQLRSYLDNLPSETDRRLFASQRIMFDSEHAHTGSAANFKRLNKYTLETPTVLRRRLERYWATKCPLPPPAQEDTQRVCMVFFAHACDRSTSWLAQPGRRQRSYQAPVTPESRRFLWSHDRVHRLNDNPKEQLVLEGFQREKDIACQLPTDDTLILPYRTKKEAHAAFVLDAESNLNCPWAIQTTQAFCTVMDFVEHEEDTREAGENTTFNPHVLDASLQQFKKAEYRYGNYLLGSKTRVPEDDRIASYPTFLRTWAKKENELRNVQLRTWMPFAKCEVCATFREALEKTKDHAEKQRLNKEAASHRAFVRRERSKYAHKRFLAATVASDHLSLIIDGADASRFSLPHFAQVNHKSDAAWKLRMYIYGCIAHGRDTYAFTTPAHVKQGHNVTIQTLHYVLLDIKRKEGRIPKTIHLQLDNTVKQCKGKYLFSYLAFLVESGVTEKIIVSFLPVGHTHEDIDQFFSRISVYLRVHNAPSRRQLGNCVKNSFTKYGKRPIVMHWDNVANIRDYIASYAGDYKDITQYHHFRIFRSEKGQ